MNEQTSGRGGWTSAQCESRGFSFFRFFPHLAPLGCVLCLAMPGGKGDRRIAARLISLMPHVFGIGVRQRQRVGHLSSDV